MRTAIVLLFLLALAAVPGSLLPQRSLSQNKVSTYFTDHPTLAPVLDRLYLFDVFSSPWFAAVYLLLFVSLIGCVLPRGLEHARALRAAPPPAPRNLPRLPDSGRLPTPLPAGRGAGRGGGGAAGPPVPRGAPRTGELSAEKGYLKETGNVLFHLSLIALLLGLAGGKLWGYEGSILVTEGQGFCNSFQQYDTYSSGPLVDSADLTPLCIDLDRLPRRVRAEPDRLLVHRRHPLRPARRERPARDHRGQPPAAGRRRPGLRDRARLQPDVHRHRTRRHDLPRRLACRSCPPTSRRWPARAR